MQKALIQLQKVKNQEYVLPQYIIILKKFKVIREEKIWEYNHSGKKEHKGAFKYYVTEKGNKMLNVVI